MYARLIRAALSYDDCERARATEAISEGAVRCRDFPEHRAIRGEFEPVPLDDGFVLWSQDQRGNRRDHWPESVETRPAWMLHVGWWESGGECREVPCVARGRQLALAI